MEKIYIFGHKKPDTDSVTSAIALSYLKNKLGYNTEPRTLGTINNETKFALDYFKISVPKYLNDVKLQIKDINYPKDIFINWNNTILDSYNLMTKSGVSTIPVIDDDKTYLGSVSMKDIARDLINGNYHLLNTSYDNILKTLNGEELLRFNEEITGNLLIASYKSTTFIESVNIDNQTIIIVGDRHSIIEYAAKSGAKMIILTGNAQIKEEHVNIAKENNVNIIRTTLSSLDVSKKINFCNFVSNIMNSTSVVIVNENDEVSDFIELANRTKYSNYPVINKNNKCLGIIRLADIADKKRKKVILVDHNEPSQSVDGIEDAEILEIVDHHKLGAIGTSMPINFRNMPVGSTNSIIFLMFKENNVEIPYDIAGIMMSGIISDTLLFKSPTTTELDKEIVKKLSEITRIDYEEYAMKMFEAGFSLEGRSLDDLLYSDFKDFTIDNKKIGIGQVSTLNIGDFNKKADDIVNLIEKVAKDNNYYLIALFVTDVKSNGSYVYYNENAGDLIKNSFDIPEIKQGYYFDGIVSRKKQIIPKIMETLEKK